MTVMDTHEQDVIKQILDMDFEDKEWWWIATDVTSDLLQVAPAKLVVVVVVAGGDYLSFCFLLFWFLIYIRKLKQWKVEN